MLTELHDTALATISNFDISPENYYILMDEKILSKSSSNKVYVKNKSTSININRIKFNDSLINSTVFIGDNLKGNVNITIQQSKSIVYIGDYCNLREVDIRTQALGSCV